MNATAVKPNAKLKDVSWFQNNTVNFENNAKLKAISWFLSSSMRVFKRCKFHCRRLRSIDLLTRGLQFARRKKKNLAGSIFFHANFCFVVPSLVTIFLYLWQISSKEVFVSTLCVIILRLGMRMDVSIVSH